VGNFTGALVFQTMAVVCFLVIFSRARLTTPGLVPVPTSPAGAALSLITLRRPGGWPVPLIGCWASLYVAGIASIIATA